MTLTIDAFTQAAREIPGGDEVTLRVSGDTVQKNGRWRAALTSQAANLRYIDEFRRTLVRAYGEGIANMAQEGLREKLEQGKPLTCGMVRQIVSEADHLAGLLGVFLSGVDANGCANLYSFDNALQGWFATHPADPPLTKGERALLKETICEALMAGRPFCRDLQAMYEAVRTGGVPPFTELQQQAHARAEAAVNRQLAMLPGLPSENERRSLIAAVEAEAARRSQGGTRLLCMDVFMQIGKAKMEAGLQQAVAAWVRESGVTLTEPEMAALTGRVHAALSADTVHYGNLAERYQAVQAGRVAPLSTLENLCHGVGEAGADEGPDAPSEPKLERVALARLVAASHGDPDRLADGQASAIRQATRADYLALWGRLDAEASLSPEQRASLSAELLHPNPGGGWRLISEEELEDRLAALANQELAARLTPPETFLSLLADEFASVLPGASLAEGVLYTNPKVPAGETRQKPDDAMLKDLLRQARADVEALASGMPRARVSEEDARAAIKARLADWRRGMQAALGAAPDVVAATLMARLLSVPGIVGEAYVRALIAPEALQAIGRDALSPWLHASADPTSYRGLDDWLVHLDRLAEPAQAFYARLPISDRPGGDDPERRCYADVIELGLAATWLKPGEAQALYRRLDGPLGVVVRERLAAEEHTPEGHARSLAFSELHRVLGRQLGIAPEVERQDYAAVAPGAGRLPQPKLARDWASPPLTGDLKLDNAASAPEFHERLAGEVAAEYQRNLRAQIPDEVRKHLLADLGDLITPGFVVDVGRNYKWGLSFDNRRLVVPDPGVDPGVAPGPNYENRLAGRAYQELAEFLFGASFAELSSAQQRQVYLLTGLAMQGVENFLHFPLLRAISPQLDSSHVEPDGSVSPAFTVARASSLVHNHIELAFSHDDAGDVLLTCVSRRGHERIIGPDGTVCALNPEASTVESLAEIVIPRRELERVAALDWETYLASGAPLPEAFQPQLEVRSLDGGCSLVLAEEPDISRERARWAEMVTPAALRAEIVRLSGAEDFQLSDSEADKLAACIRQDYEGWGTAVALTDARLQALRAERLTAFVEGVRRVEASAWARQVAMPRENWLFYGEAARLQQRRVEQVDIALESARVNAANQAAVQAALARFDLGAEISARLQAFPLLVGKWPLADLQGLVQTRLAAVVGRQAIRATPPQEINAEAINALLLAELDELTAVFTALREANNQSLTEWAHHRLTTQKTLPSAKLLPQLSAALPDCRSLLGPLMHGPLDAAAQRDFIRTLPEVLSQRFLQLAATLDGKGGQHQTFFADIFDLGLSEISVARARAMFAFANGPFGMAMKTLAHLAVDDKASEQETLTKAEGARFLARFEQLHKALERRANFDEQLKLPNFSSYPRVETSEELPLLAKTPEMPRLAGNVDLPGALAPADIAGRLDATRAWLKPGLTRRLAAEVIRQRQGDGSYPSGLAQALARGDTVSIDGIEIKSEAEGWQVLTRLCYGEDARYEAQTEENKAALALLAGLFSPELTEPVEQQARLAFSPAYQNFTGTSVELAAEGKRRFFLEKNEETGSFTLTAVGARPCSDLRTFGGDVARTLNANKSRLETVTELGVTSGALSLARAIQWKRGDPETVLLDPIERLPQVDVRRLDASVFLVDNSNPVAGPPWARHAEGASS